MMKLSKTQQKVLDKLMSHRERMGELPDLSAFARELGIHYVSLRQHLQALDKKGVLEFRSRGTGQSPILKLVVLPSGVPVLGSIPAGPLSEALQEPEGYLPLRAKEGLFALRVSGDSMAELIQDQDVVLLRRGLTPRPGDICAVRIGDSDATLKHLEWSGRASFTLRPHNPDYPPLHVDAREVFVEGVYQGLLRGDITHALYQKEI